MIGQLASTTAQASPKHTHSAAATCKGSGGNHPILEQFSGIDRRRFLRSEAPKRLLGGAPPARVRG